MQRPFIFYKCRSVICILTHSKFQAASTWEEKAPDIGWGSDFAGQNIDAQNVKHGRQGIALPHTSFKRDWIWQKVVDQNLLNDPLYRVAKQALNDGPKPKCSNKFNRKFLSTRSNAFSWSSDSKIPASPVHWLKRECLLTEPTLNRLIYRESNTSGPGPQ